MFIGGFERFSVEYQKIFDKFLEVVNRNSVVKIGSFQEIVLGNSRTFQGKHR